MHPVAERDQGVLFEEEREAVVGALRGGEEDEAILPTARTSRDDFAAFLPPPLLEQFRAVPDEHARHSIPTVFGGVPPPLPPPLSPAEPGGQCGGLCRSPFPRGGLGFNARLIAEGFHASVGSHPFTAKTLEDSFADMATEPLLAHGVDALGCLTIAAPRGFRASARLGRTDAWQDTRSHRRAALRLSERRLDTS